MRLCRSPGAWRRLRSGTGHRPRPDRLEHAVPPRHLIASLVALAAVTVPIAGCGGSSPAPSAAKQATPSGSSPSKAAGGSGSVSIANFKFAPASLTVSAGTRVTVANRDTTAHTVTADDGRSFDTGSVDPGSSATVSVPKPGTYKYHCSIHPFMHGTLVVR